MPVLTVHAENQMRSSCVTVHSHDSKNVVHAAHVALTACSLFGLVEGVSSSWSNSGDAVAAHQKVCMWLLAQQTVQQ